MLWLEEHFNAPWAVVCVLACVVVGVGLLACHKGLDDYAKGKE